MTRTPKISIPLPMIWMKWSIDGSKLLTAFSIFAPPTAAGAQPIITIGAGNCSGAGPGLLAIAAEARDNGPAIDSERFRPARLNGFVEGKNLAVIPGGFESTDDN